MELIDIIEFITYYLCVPGTVCVVLITIWCLMKSAREHKEDDIPKVGVNKTEILRCDECGGESYLRTYLGEFQRVCSNSNDGCKRFSGGAWRNTIKEADEAWNNLMRPDKNNKTHRFVEVIND